MARSTGSERAARNGSRFDPECDSFMLSVAVLVELAC
jgi:hypothetical protein